MSGVSRSSNPQQSKLLWMSTRSLVSIFSHTVLKNPDTNFFGAASVAADTANRTKPVSPNTIMYCHPHIGQGKNDNNKLDNKQYYVYMYDNSAAFRGYIESPGIVHL